MTVTAKIQALDRDLLVSLTQDISPAAQSAALVGFANAALADAEQTDTAALGSTPTYETFVDGQRGASLSSAKPTSVIVFEFDIVTPAVQWIYDQLETHSPVKTGRYKKSQTLYVDGDQSEVGTIPDGAKELIFAPTVPYAQRIERGWSKQAPDGVYQVVAALARQRFGNVAKISFGYTQVHDLELAPSVKMRTKGSDISKRDLRQPAIIIEI